MIARNAILEELKRRFKDGDKTVKPYRPTVNPYSDEDEQPITNGFSGAGWMPCPVCKIGKLSYSRASYNLHVHASCSTDTCVRWME